jgi:peptidoglycan/xylan/chitin deacetylase (PgdA/CDA1 family)
MAVDSILNVCFHGVGTPKRGVDPGEVPYWADTSDFLRILDDIATWPSVQISFDDANDSDVLIAMPALLDRGLKAQFFVVAGRLDTAAFLTTDAVRELAAKDMTIGTHGMSHRSWLDMTSDIREAELIEARRCLEDAISMPVTEAACPLGRYDRRLLADLRRLGYQQVYTSDRAVARRGSWLQPRFSVRSRDTPQSLRAALLSASSRAGRARQSVKSLVKQLR